MLWLGAEQRIAAVQERMRCRPPVSDPGDPSFTIETPSEEWAGSLPRDPAGIASRTGICGARAALAWWIVQRFGVPGLSAR